MRQEQEMMIEPVTSKEKSVIGEGKVRIEEKNPNESRHLMQREMNVKYRI